MAIKEISNNPTLAGQVRLIENVVYAAAGGEAQTMSILAPWTQRHPEMRQAKYPLIVFVQGSSWTSPTLGEEIPQLVQFVHAGYIVATVKHRSALDGYAFPAFLQDVKTAIRYLRAHADEYQIDPNRVGIWGTSSGANAAMLVALTGDDPKYKTAGYADQSDKVDAVISCFGPTDVEDTFKFSTKVPGSDAMQICLFGMDPTKWPAIKREMSPLYQIKAGQAYPPFLLMHGDADKTVPYHEMEDMYEALTKNNVDVEAYRIKGADHELDFWSQTVYDLARDFLDRNVK
ncbi:MAG: alpha/beta hydrolase [Ligilactobacillus agilis]|nr:alpha/beta hydrolase [Ligilactobacillus agilis]